MAVRCWWRRQRRPWWTASMSSIASRVLGHRSVHAATEQIAHSVAHLGRVVNDSMVRAREVGAPIPALGGRSSGTLAARSGMRLPCDPECNDTATTEIYTLSHPAA